MLQLVALVHDVCKIEVEFPHVLETNVLGVEEGCEPRVVDRTDVERDLIVELADGDFVKLFVCEADVLEVGRTIDLWGG